MIYITGAVFWVAAWALISLKEPEVMAAAFCSWIGLVMWELAMRENRRLK